MLGTVTGEDVDTDRACAKDAKRNHYGNDSVEPDIYPGSNVYTWKRNKRISRL